MQFNVHTAKTQLSKLIEHALAGEEVIIARGDKPVVRLVAIEQTRKPFVFGTLEGLVGPGPEFEPISDEELDKWEKDGEARISEALNRSTEET